MKTNSIFSAFFRMLNYLKQFTGKRYSLFCSLVLVAFFNLSAIFVRAQRPALNTDCGLNSDIFADYFRLKESYCPPPQDNPLFLNAANVEKKIKMRFVIVVDDLIVKHNFWDTPADNAKLNYIVERMNYYLRNNATPTHPVSGFSGAYYNRPNTKFQIELTDISFVYDTVATYGLNDTGYLAHGLYTDSILNVYFIYNPSQFDNTTNTLIGGGWAKDGGNVTTFLGSNQLNKPHIGQWNLYAVNNSDYALDIEAKRMIHELGHAMGFPHLEDEVGSSSSIDYLADVLGSGYPATSPWGNNFMMAHAEWENYAHFCFTPTQLGLMHRVAHMSHIKRYVYPNENVNNHPWQINEEQTWDFPVKIFQNIVVNPGATLTIKCEVQMPEGARILVKKGGKLVVDGGWVHSYHQKLRWKGIELEGDENAPSNAALQGTVELKNGAIIENAWEAIQNFTWDNGAKGGGIIRAKDAYFYNNWRSVALNYYPNMNYTNNGCIIDNCTFEIDDMSAVAPAGGAFERQITSWNTLGGVIIKNSDFKVSLTEAQLPYPDRPRAAIEPHTTGMSVFNCSINGFYKGIYAIGYDGHPGKTLYASGNTITNTNRGIEVGGVAMTQIKDNHINSMNEYITYPEPGLMQIVPPVGIYIDNTVDAYVGCGNQIDLTGTGRLGASSIGLLANNTQKAGAVFLDNIVTKANRAVQTQLDNRNLSITCNSLENSKVAIMANPASYGYLLNNQGTGCGPNEVRAGNKFINNNVDIRSYTLNTWNYYAANSPLNSYELPLNNNGTVNVIQCNLPEGDRNSQCNKDELNCNMVPLANIMAAEGRYHNLKEAGLQQSAEARVLYSNIVHSYYYLQNEAGLFSFLENEADPLALRLLIPMYIHTGQSLKAANAINSLDAGEADKDAYHNYYALVADMRQQQRHPASLTTVEQAMVTDLAAGAYEVSGFAKAMLEIAGIATWLHPVEEEDEDMMSSINTGKPQVQPKDEQPVNTMHTQLYAAQPNPAVSNTTVKAYVSSADAQYKSYIAIRNITTGKVLMQELLTEGLNEVRFNTEVLIPGMYTYCLIVNGKVLSVKKLSVVK